VTAPRWHVGKAWLVGHLQHGRTLCRRERGQDDRLPPQMLDQGAGQHNALVGLHGQFGQR
jgi:hypothetical protein